MSISTKQLKAFWKVTNLLRWKEHGDRKFVEVYLTLKFSRQEIGDFKDIGSTLASALVQRLNFWAATQWPPQKDGEPSMSWWTLGDDGLFDLCCQIVGEGKEAYDQATEFPITAYKRAITGDFNENFLYGFTQSLREDERI